MNELSGEVRKALGELEAMATSGKQTLEAVKKAHNELDGRVSRIHEELKAGTLDATTKAAYQDAVEKVAKVEKSLDALNTEVTELGKKAANLLSGNTEQKSLGQLAAESEAAKSYRGGMAELCTMNGPLFGKAALVSGATSAGALLEPYRVPGIVTGPDMPVTVRDLFQAVTISSSSVEWVREKLFTNNAGPQAGEGAVKRESAIQYEKKTSPVEVIAHWIPASRQILSDAPQLAGVVDGRLRMGLKIKEDEALLFGDGTNGNLLGLVPQATVYSSTGIPAGATKIDHLRWAFLQVAKAMYPATFAVLSLDDWALIQMMKTTEGAYIFGTPTDGAAPRIWGKRVVESYGLEAGDFVAGSGFAATIYDREEVTVRVAEQHADFFIKNMVALLCEERIAFTVERPAAIVAGGFPAPSGG
ncbi:phage major capsid protein [Paracidovorax cattleyae]|uniref:phage major capsid protein n=1 Tax=Paracidovorax cattleyae TaxID=80868 RepID=UPI0018AFC811|nr:phage major capsid protein [Paracidovorax cattleyae]MBF9263930.1 phage major capsid protein [Paracidovorax cattleyae]